MNIISIWKNFFDTKKRYEGHIAMAVIMACIMIEYAFQSGGFVFGAMAVFMWTFVIPYVIWLIDGRPTY
jgi:hypothetical protein